MKLQKVSSNWVPTVPTSDDFELVKAVRAFIVQKYRERPPRPIWSEPHTSESREKLKEEEDLLDTWIREFMDTLEEYQEKIRCNWIRSNFLDTFPIFDPVFDTNAFKTNRDIDSVDEYLNAYWKFQDGSLDSYENFIGPILKLIQDSQNEPVNLSLIGYSSHWLYKNACYFYEDNHGIYSTDEIKLLIYEEFDKERRRFEKLRNKFLSPEVVENSQARPKIPEVVRIEVWRRDGGKCARCGSRENLEYDHIIPISKGGSNTARNIELLCEKCNRSKGASII